MIEVLKPGLQSTVQDWPGRKGYYGRGFPPCGPIDPWSFRLANLLVGNDAGAAALECQYVGPSLRFQSPAVIAVCGADMQPELDGRPLELWRSHSVAASRVLSLSFAKLGARAYVAVSGGIDVPEFLGSRATFLIGGVGGLDGEALKEGSILPVGIGQGTPDLVAPKEIRPAISRDKSWSIEVVAGPHDDWIDDAGHERFLNSEWRLTAKSNRVGFRLSGPTWTYTRLAHEKDPESGSDPSNTADYGYPIGGVNVCGDTSIILMNDALTWGGFIIPYTVPTSAFPKLGQSRPGDRYDFGAITVEEAQQKSQVIDAMCRPENLRSA